VLPPAPTSSVQPGFQVGTAPSFWGTFNGGAVSGGAAAGFGLTTNATQANINSYGILSLIQSNPSGSTSALEKSAVFGWCVDEDTTASAAAHGCYGGTFYSQNQGPSNGSLWGINVVASVTSGDAGLRAEELDINNVSGADISAPDTLHAKNALGIFTIATSGTKNATSAIEIGNAAGGTTNGFHNGIIMTVIAGGNPIQVNNWAGFGGVNVCVNNSGQFVISSNCSTVTPLIFGTPSPTCSTGIGSGTCAIEAGSTDGAGAIILTFMTGPGSTSGVVELNFGTTPFGANPPKCLANLSQGNPGGQWNARATVFPETPNTSSQNFDWDNNGTQIGLLLASVYRIAYNCSPS